MEKRFISTNFGSPGKRLSIFTCIVVLLFIVGSVQPGWTEANINHVDKVGSQPVKDVKKMTGKRTSIPGFGNIPLYFIPNKGQMHEKALFCAKTPGYTLWLTKEGLVFDSMKKAEIKATHPAPSGHPSQEGSNRFSHSPHSPYLTHSPKLERDVSRLIFLKANKNPLVVPGEPTAHRANYLKGSDKSQWHTGIPTSRAVCYKNLYKNIDLKVYGVEKQIEYDWAVKPGGNPADIRFQYQGVKKTSRDEAGNLVVQTAFGQWTHKKPLAYQEIDGKKVFVEAAFKRLKGGKNTYGFQVAPYDRNYELIIDPMVIAFSTYLGGSEMEDFYSLYVTGSGAVYEAGDSDSNDFPVENAYQSSRVGGIDAVVTKLSADGTSLVFSTYIGGSEYDGVNAVWVDGSGIVYVGGATMSSDFPTVNAYQSYNAGPEYSTDGFIAKLSADGSSLLYSTYLGGNWDDAIRDIAVNSGGDIYAAGYTSSSDFPVESALQASSNGSADNFVLKLSSSGSSLVFSTYLGGSRWDEAHAITLDTSGAVYVAGWTLSSDFPVVNAFQSSDGNGGCTSCNDAFLSKISPDGQTLVYSTYLGGDSSDEIHDIKVDGSGAVYLVGSTGSSNFPTTPGAFQETVPSLYGWNVFISKFNSSMSAFLYSTYLGGTDNTNSIGSGMDIAADGTAYVTGYTECSDFPIRDPIQDSLQSNYSSAFVTALAPDGSDITFSTYLGGADEGSGNDIILDSSGNVYVVGWTEEGFLIHNEVQNSYGGGWQDGFVTKMVSGPIPDITVTAPNGGEEWYVFSTYDITWTADASVEYVSIDISPDNGVFWENITPSTPNTGSYSWTIPEFLSGNDCIVRVKDKFSSAADTSDEVFSIIRLPIIVTSPNGGENWASYYSYDITWNDDWSISDVSIDYSTDGGASWIPIVSCILNDRYYSWTIPDTPSDNCLVRVSDAFGTDSDVSNEVFSIVPAGYFIETVSPNGGEDWAAGTSHDILWSTGGSISSVSIDYSIDGGNTWTPIVLSTPDTGYFNWTVPNTPSGNCLVRVSDTGGMSSDVSDSAFTISTAVSPFISVTSPNGGEEWYIGSSYDITWSYSGPIGYVSIDYSIDGGNSWIPIVSSITNTGSHNWTIPDTPSTECLVRVKDPGGTPSDTSDRMFTITDPMIPLSERNALIELYNSTNGDYWGFNNNWRHPQDPNQFNDRGTEHTWYGITCNPEQTHVIEIVMYSNNLYGNLPDLSALTELRVLILEHGYLQGEIPATLNNLHNLETLNLYLNQFSGTIPDLSNLTNLENLHLHHNWLGGGIPPEIGNLTGLQVLLLSGNQLVGSIPPTLLNLTNLMEGGSDFRWNGLYTDDINLRDFLNSKQIGGDWESTQTIAPTGLTVSEETYNSINVSWIPILYQGGYGGGYRVYSSTTSGSDYTLAGTTADKAADNYTVTNLEPNTTYYFVVESFTDPHGGNLNTVTSEYSTEISGTTSVPPTLTVTAPNGGEEWEVNTVRDITWTNDGNIENVMIEYSVDNGNSWNVIEDTFFNDGFYAWMVPDTLSGQCLVKVSDKEGYASDVSDAVFAITEPGAITVTTPNGGENWEGGTNHNITWTSTGNIANVMIEYSVDGGSTWNIVTGFTANSGTYNWTVPNTPSNNCLVSISDPAGPALDTSDAVFTILPQRTLTVTVPNGGENWEAVTVKTITWSGTGSIANVMIEYSTDNGSSWNTITGSTTNTGSYDWTIPNTPSSGCLVRISDTAGPASDVSNAVFNILEQRTITVTVPNGGEDWQVDSIHDITWTTTGAVANVDIEYSTNSGSSWNAIVFYTANTGTYSWTVPGIPSSDCLVRVSDNAGLAWDASDAAFTISTPTIPSTERDALIALYNSTNGDSWTDNTNWRKPGEPTQFNDPGTEPTWYGVTCNPGNTQVEKVELSNNNLVGTIPAELDQLYYLNTLDLGWNQLSGTIPTLGNLAQLENFILENNALTGSVPTWLNNLGTLKDISLGHNQLSGTIPDLSSLSQLNTLGLSDNQLTDGIPAWLDNLTGLNTLNLGSNQLTGTITDLGSLTNLNELSLHDNQLTGSIPAWLDNLTSLNTLNLALNQLTGNIPDLSSLTNLIDLKLHSNQLTGAIPSWISVLTNLKNLELQSNQLSGNIPADLGNLTALENLFLNGNQLIGDIPAPLTDLTNLLSTGLNISWNGLYTDDTNLRDFLNSKSSEDWEATQTIAPGGLSGGEESQNSIKVSWTPIQYQGDTGEYRVYYSTTSGSGYTLAGTTADKTEDNYTVTGLDPGTTYYFVVETVTGSHAGNQNTVISEYSTEISVATLEEPTLTVTAPNGGETWETNTVQTITWASTGNIDDVKIESSTDNGNTWNTVIASTANSGSYDWTIPNTPSANCLVKIIDVGGPAQDQSDAVFTIAEQRTVTVTAPNGGENWEGNTNKNITWTNTGSIANVTIEYSTDNGSSWNTVTASTANSGTYNWTVPNSPSGNCLVKVSDTAGPASDTSDAVFTILQQRTLTVSAPNGGENWEAVTVQTITWSSTGGIPTVMIEYSADNGASWNTITGSTTNTGSYDWTIPNTPSSNCLVKISDIAGPASDVSDAVFNILEQRTITVTVPNGGEDWQVDSIHDITWTTTGAVGNVAIDYSTDNGSSWNSIVSSTANTGTYSWTVPDTPSSDYLVRISDTAGPASDNSDAPFTISIPTISSTERDALIALYNSTNGDSWTDNTNWRKPGEPTQFNDPGTEPTWYGVTCNVDNTRVEKVELSNNNLVGTIPAELDQLLYLNTLNLSENQLGGTIPDLTGLAQLNYLYLDDNQLTGGIPTWLNTLTGLKTLNLSRNQLSATIPDLSSLSQLNYLYLDNNQLTGAIPSWLNSLVSLRALDLKFNQLSGTIPDLSNLTYLNYLVTANNQLTGSIPTWLNDLTNLNSLDLRDNQLTGTIPDLSSLSKLSYLALHSNQLTGNIPSWFNNLTNLSNLGLSSNQLTGSIPDLSNLTKLSKLNLSYNQLTGSIPPELGNLNTTLTYIHLHHNQLSGSIPAELGNLTALNILNLNSNQLVGSIPGTLSNLVNLSSTGLNISWNGLYTSDGNLRDFLNSRSLEDWQATQTIAPESLSGGEESHNSVKVSWIPIQYQADTGEYRVYYSTTSGSDYTLAGTTADKTEDNYTVTGLEPDTTYYFVVETVTGPHSSNQNTVISEYSTEISAATIEEPTLTVTAPNGGESWEANTVQTITWTSTGNIDDVKIESSTDNGNTWNTVIASTTNSGSYDWTIPNTPSANCLVKIIDVGGPAQDQSDAVFTVAEQRTLTVTAPNGGENWEGNTSQNITWASTGSIANVMIEYSTDSGTSWNTITGSTANSGTYNWTVPNSPSGNCLVKVSDTAGPASDTSDAAFTILQQRTLTVTAPNGGENWEAVTVQTITWASTGGIATVMIEYSTDNGGSWNTVTGSTTNTGTYDWTIPNTPSSNCLVRISDTAGPASDVSDAVFNILEQRTITVTVPNGGEDWQVDSIHDITWTTSGAVGNVAIDYSTDNGSSWNSIVSSTANTGTYSWTVPDTPSNDCLVRISDTAGPASDNSDAPFTISIPTISSTQRDALIALYNSTNGDSWTDNTNWRKPGEPTQFNDPGTEPTWYGVTCNVNNTQVEKIELSNNNLVGTIPAELAQLLYLNTLNLNGNQLGGTIPDLTGLAQLNYLYLYNNQLTGGIPTWLNTLSGLKTLNLSSNQLNGTIPDLSSLAQLNGLDLGHNQLTGGIPGWLNNLVNLKTLNLEFNQLSGTIPDLSGLTNLTTLILSFNQLTGNLPGWLNNLTSLSNLILYDNQLTGTIPDLSGLTNLAFLNLSNNQLAGGIPSWIGDLTNMRDLRMASNQLTGSIPDLSNLTKLYALMLQENQLSGTIPPEIGNLTDFRYIYLYGNQLSGNIPMEFGNLTLLVQLYLQGNQLVGSIPGTLSNLTNLSTTGLSISWNGLYTNDTDLRDFLDSKHASDWESTQTIAPTGLSTSEETSNSVKVSWTPIPYQGDTGEYRVYYSTTSGSGYILAGTTADKTAANYTVTGLDPSTTYYFVVETVTEPHSSNQNTVTSEYSTEISAATLQEPTLAVTAPNGGESWEATAVQTVTWASTGNINDVKIEYTTDSGNTWNTVIASITNSGSYNWTIPNTPSANCLVKISDVSGPAQDQSDALFTIAEQRTLTVTAPNGGENWEGNTNQNITWNTTGSIPNVKIEYSTDNGSSWNTIAASTANSGTYNWTVPNTPSGTCLVKVSDTAGPASDVSDAVFTIAEQRTVTVSTPNGGESWESGFMQTITWTGTGNIANVMIEYSADGGGTWNTVTGSTANSGTYNWTVPNSPSGNCLVRISDTAGPASDTSDAVFTILQQRTLTLTAPNGGENWEAVTVQTITWSYTGGIATVMIEYSTDNGGSWNTVTGSTTNTGSYDWTIPNTPSSNCLVRISDTAGPASDIGDAVFNILEQRTITVTVPNGGEDWQVDSIHDITWTTTGAVGNVAIDYSTDDGSSWNSIVSSTANTGTYSWTIPDTPSGDCLVRISDTAGPASDNSDAPFTISTPTISSTERDALIALYNSTNGDSWTDNTNWRKPGEPSQFNDPGTEPTWYGVTCNVDNTRVEKVELSNNNLVGTIPADLDQLLYLNTLNLSENQLGGTIPDLTGLAQLNYLYLDDNQLTGGIPTWLNTLVSLSVLDLGLNQLSGTIPDLSNLTNLSNLGIYNNQLTGSIPTWLNSLTGLTDLRLSGNQLSGTIPDLGSLTNLIYLQLSTNQLTGGIPSWMNILTNLQNIDLSSNQLSGGIPDLSSLTALTSLKLSNNQLTGSIPPGLGNLAVLEYLYLQENQLDGNIPSEIGNLTALKQLYLYGNRLIGDIPGTLTNLINLLSTGLNISWNCLYTDDTNLRDFLNSRSAEDWQATQTIAPEGLSNSEESQNSVKVSWTPIQYQGDSGEYRVYYSTTSGSDYTLAGTTADKTEDNYTVTGLDPDTTYYFVVGTVTGPHSSNQNTVISEYSTEISAATIEEPTLTVTAPNGGESWEANTVQTITWTSTGSIANVKIEYSTDNGSSWNTITGSTANDGSHNWTIPNTPSGICLVKVSDTAGPTSDVSDTVFTIAEQRTVTVTSPNGGENWDEGTTRTITWTYTGTIANVDIDYSTNGGTSWNSIVSSTPNTGSYNWAIPAVESANCLVRVSDTETTASDSSDAVFNMWKQPSITVTAPNGGETWKRFTTQTITWTNTGNIQDVKIQYSQNAGGYWEDIVSSTPNNGSYQWYIPSVNQDKTQCLVRVMTLDAAVVDTSDSYFTIIKF